MEKFIFPILLTLILTLIICDKMSKYTIRKLIQNSHGQFTITLPVEIMRIMNVRKGEKFKVIYQPKNKKSFNTITLVRMGCNAA